jgi:hypothetical protein
VNGPVFYSFLLLFALSALGAERGNWRMADLYYGRDDYGRAYELYEEMILRGDGGEAFGDVLYRYGYCYEQTRGLDNRALKIYALSRYYNEREGAASRYLPYAGAKLEGRDPYPGLDEGAAASALAELRESINGERKAPLYGGADRVYSFLSRFSVFEWKIIVSLAMLIPFFAGIAILGLRGREPRP